ncbi:MAG: hypothetical protein JNM63_13435, partial [Spirochaetia bacterium]|nr:hypothetical protein [Spirochaetia bacterium]
SFPTSKRQPLRIYHELPLSEKWNTVTLPFDAPPGYTNGAVLSAMLAYSKGQIEFSSLEMESVGPFASTPEGTVFSGKAVAACGELKSIYLNQLSVSRANDPVSFREEVKILDEYLENEISNRGPDGFWKKANEDASRLRVAVNLHIFSILYQLPESRYHRAASALEWTTQWTEYLTSHMGPEGRWFLNDPNIDRFILLPLLEAVVYLEPLLTNELRAKTFQTLHRAALFQTQTHNLDGWNFSMAGSYGNMDAYASVIFALAGKIFDKKDWVDLGIKTFLTTHERGIRPQGGYDYIAGGNPVPHYQDYVVWNGAKTWLVTGDVRIRDSLAQSREYYPLFTLRTGITDHGVTPPIKHVWGNCGNMVGPEVIAYLTGD